MLAEATLDCARLATAAIALSTRGCDCRATQPFLTITAVIAKLAYRGASPDDDHRFPGACLRGERSEATLAQRAKVSTRDSKLKATDEMNPT